MLKMSEKFEHRGTLEAVRSKLKRIKKSKPRYFIFRKFEIKPSVVGENKYILVSSPLVERRSNNGN